MSIATCVDKEVREVKDIHINWTSVISFIIIGLFSIVMFFMSRTINRIDAIENSVLSIKQNVATMTVSLEDLQESQDKQFQVLLKLLEKGSK